MGTASACELYGTSSNLPFDSFSWKCEIFNSRFTQIPTSWSLEKPGWGGEGQKKPPKNDLIQALKFGLSIRSSFQKSEI